MPAYFTRGSGHNAKGQYSERPDDYVENMDRLARKFETARSQVPQPVVETRARRQDRLHRLRHVALGDRRRAATSCAKKPTSKTSYFRLRAYPFTDELTQFIDAHERVYVIEQNRDAQLLQLMRLELTPERRSPSCAACSTTAACRSTPAASPTTCWRRKATKWRRKRRGSADGWSAGRLRAESE